MTALAAVLVCASSASADVVTNTNDAGAGSLRAAIASTAPGGTVTFDPSVTGTITLTTGVLQVTNDLTITGPGARTLTVSGNNASQVFQISGAGVDVTIRNLTIANGQTPDSGFEQGGGISVGNGATSLVLEDSTVADNTAGPAIFDAAGGGIYASGAAITVRRTTFSGNRAIGESTASANGGAISAQEFGDALTIENSTLAGNQATSENSASGGAVEVFGSVAIRNTTIAFNTVDAQFFERGGGVFASTDGPATREIQASIIAANTITGGAPGASNDCDLGETVPGNDNVIGDPSDCDVSGTNNVLGTAAPGLNALANRGGPTNTVSLTESSPALNHVANANCPPPTIDQRGLPRPVGSACESGAWEGQLGLTLTPPSHDYGTVTLPASTSRAATFRVAGPTFRFTVTNTGELTVNLSSIVVNNATFAIVPSADPGACGATVAAGASCFIDVQFNPTAPGAQSGTLTVASTNAGTLTAALSGNAVRPPDNPPPPPNDPCAPDTKAPKVTITSDQHTTLYGLGQTGSITTKASDASGLTSDPSRKGQKLATDDTGSFIVRKTARDKCDNTGSATFRYRVVAPPKASIVHEASPSGCRTRLVALAKIDSPVGLKASQIFIDGKLKVTSTKPILRARVMTRQLANGTHTMLVSAIDTLGRKVTSRATFVIRCSSR